MALFQKVFGLKPGSFPDEDAKAKAEEFWELYNEKNPETGLRYDIPMLKRSDPDYEKKYVQHMRTKKQDPSLFNKILNWD